jgi:Domain of unknown function (DUF5069)
MSVVVSGAKNTPMAKQPRSGSESLGGLTWLARMLDKARLKAEGTIAEFDLEYPCPMDQQCLAKLGVSSQVFQTIAVEQSTDEGVLAALKAAGANLPVTH